MDVNSVQFILKYTRRAHQPGITSLQRIIAKSSYNIMNEVTEAGPHNHKQTCCLYVVVHTYPLYFAHNLMDGVNLNVLLKIHRCICNLTRKIVESLCDSACQQNCQIVITKEVYLLNVAQSLEASK